MTEHRDMPPAVTPESLGLVFRAKLVKDLIVQTNEQLHGIQDMPADLDLELKHLNTRELTFYLEHFKMAGWLVSTNSALDRDEEYITRLWPVFDYKNKE